MPSVMGSRSRPASVGLALSRLFTRRAIAAPVGFGPLVKDPAGILDLPAGFTYKVLQRAGEPMGKYKVPGCPE